jgi:hypothetical protein
MATHKVYGTVEQAGKEYLITGIARLADDNGNPIPGFCILGVETDTFTVVPIMDGNVQLVEYHTVSQVVIPEAVYDGIYEPTDDELMAIENEQWFINMTQEQYA